MRFLLFFCLFLPGVVFSQGQSANQIHYIENKGQWNKEVQFKAEIQGANLWLTSTSFVFDFASQEDMAQLHEKLHNRPYGDSSEVVVRRHAYKVNFLGANPALNYSGRKTLSTYNNYFLGNDPSKWASQVAIHTELIGESLYEGIDLVAYSNEGNFKYDLIVHPRAKVDQIKLQYEDAVIERYHKELKVALSVGDVFEHAPIAYQVINDNKKMVACEFKVEGNTLSFHFPKGYNKKYDLIIDPELIFSTYTGSTADNWGFTATYDQDGNAYGGGIVESTGYPLTTGAYSQVYSGGRWDVGITKYNSEGSNLIFSTYLGGSNAEHPHSLMVDSENNLVVMGSTKSTDFPTTIGAFNETYNGGFSDIFVTKFNNTGTSLLASTYIGGSDKDGLLDYNDGNTLNPGSTSDLNVTTTSLRHNYGDEARGEVFIDENDEIYIASVSSSSDFPTTLLSEEQIQQGGQDAVIVRFDSSLETTLFSTFIGGSEDDAAYSIKKKGELIVAVGGTASVNFPATSSSLNPTFLGGPIDGFIVSLDSNGSIYNASFIGTNAYDQAYFVEIDPDFNVFITGQTEGAYPVSSGVYFNENGSQFVQEMNSELSLSILSTVFGTGGTQIDISPTAFLVDQCDHVYISGWGGLAATGSTTGLPVTADAFQSTTDGNDFYFIVFDKDLEGLLYATFFGGMSSAEHVDGGTSRFDDNGIIYQAVCAGCQGVDAFPTTPGAWSQINGSNNCNLGTLKMDFNFAGLDAEAIVNDSVFCEDPPFLVPFHGSGEQVPYHFWSFGDGETSNLANPIHQYEEQGLYDVVYIVIDSNTCNISDTSYATVEVIQKEVFAMEWQATEPTLCEDTLYVEMAFIGTGADSLIWDMGDGTIFYNDTFITYSYYIPGVYEASLTAIDTDCDEVGVTTQTYVLSDNIISGQLAVPNIFSPNGDGVNDEFRLFFVDKPNVNPLVAMDYYHVIIYNRWGRVVFESGDARSDWEWDGTIDGKDADDGVYYYILLYNSLCEDNGTSRKTGYITLVR